MKHIIISLLVSMLCSLVNAQDIIISEVISSNADGITDFDGSSPDWIEIYNKSTKAINLSEYSISNNSTNPKMFVFPDTIIQPGQYMLLIANEGYKYIDDITFYETVIDLNDQMKYLLPTSEPNDKWKTNDFDDSSWLTGRSGFGYGDNDDTTIINPTNAIYIRKTFNLNDLNSINNMYLHIDYDDGFVAYINGKEIARAGFDSLIQIIPFNLNAYEHEALMYRGRNPVEFNISKYINYLLAGDNTFALQVHNSDVTSSDLTAIPFLTLAYSSIPPNAKGSSDYLPYNNRPNINGIYINFTLDADEDTVFLYHNNLPCDTITIINQPTDISIGRENNSSDLKTYYFTQATPGTANIYSKYPPYTLPKPTFSHQGGKYDQSFILNLTTNIYGSAIRYTTNGEEPTNESSVFTKPIQIDSNTNIKARLFMEGYLPGKTSTNSYIFNQTNQTLPIVSLTINPDDFFDYYKGIYELGPNASDQEPFYGANYWQNWERPIHVELFEPDGTTGFTIDAGVKIFGNWSRCLPMKSLAIYTRNKYGNKSIDYQIFKDKPIDEFKNFLLRNSGNDFNRTMFRDGMIHNLAKNMQLERMAYRPSIVFLNGKYWGIHNIREKVNEFYIESNTGANEDSLTILFNNGQIICGSNESYFKLVEFIENNNLSVQSNFDTVAKYIDINNFINYYTLEIYVVNEDWPGNNIKFWKKNKPNEKWRYILFDTDIGFAGINDDQLNHDMIDYLFQKNHPGAPNSAWSTLFFRKFIENESFKIKFINAMADRLNTTLHPDSVIINIDTIHHKIKNEIPNHIAKWEFTGNDTEIMNHHIQYVKTFAQNRPDIVRTHYMQHFNINGIYPLNLSLSDNNAGRISLNSISINQFPWSGIYFNNIPITLTAIPKPGYQFIRWEGDYSSNNATLTVLPNSITNIKAVFEYNADIKPDIFFTEIFYHSENSFPTNDWIELYNNSNKACDISHWIIKDKQPFNNFSFPNNTIIKPNSYLIICSDTSQFKLLYPDASNYIGNLSFKLSNNFESILLYDTLTNLIDKVSYTDYQPWPQKADGYGFTLSLTYPYQNNDNPSNWNAEALHGTPGVENNPFIQDPNRSNIIINEINYKSNENSNSGDWIEIYNNADTTIDLSGWVLNDKTNKSIFVVPQNTKIPSKCYLIFTQTPSLFKLIYPLLTDTININFGLESTSDQVRIYDQYETIVDSVCYFSQTPWPIEANGTGKTLSLIAPFLDNSMAQSWKASINLGTPGKANILNYIEKPTDTLQPPSVYPTYFTNHIYINPSEKSHVIITNENGQTIDSFNIQSKIFYTFKNIPNGIYFIYIKNNANTSVHKIVKY